jgi:hypothetical protein
MRKTLLVLCAAIALAGCAAPSVESLRQTQGQGVKRTVRQPYDAVYEAVLGAIAKRKLELNEQDRANGRLVLSSDHTRTSFGERIAVFVTRNNDRSTTVEVVSKAAGSPLTFPPDWPALLFGDIDLELTVRRPK